MGSVARDFDSVVPEIDVVHLIPIEVLNEEQFGFFGERSNNHRHGH